MDERVGLKKYALYFLSVGVKAAKFTIRIKYNGISQ
jgi:hypothetical protein